MSFLLNIFFLKVTHTAMQQFTAVKERVTFITKRPSTTTATTTTIFIPTA